MVSAIELTSDAIGIYGTVFISTTTGHAGRPKRFPRRENCDPFVSNKERLRLLAMEGNVKEKRIARSDERLLYVYSISSGPRGKEIVAEYFCSSLQSPPGSGDIAWDDEKLASLSKL